MRPVRQAGQAGAVRTRGRFGGGRRWRASLALLAIAAPVITVIAALIRVTSPGSVLFKQRRMGLNGRIFTLYKFRTMIEDAHERRGEIAIMQAIGGARWLVAAMLGLEVALIGLVGGIAGALLGGELARIVGESVFHDVVEISPVLPFVIMLAAIAVALAGAWQPLRRTMRMDPAVILREGV